MDRSNYTLRSNFYKFRLRQTYNIARSLNTATLIVKFVDVGHSENAKIGVSQIISPSQLYDWAGQRKDVSKGRIFITAQPGNRL